MAGIVLLSGGLDSTVALALYLEKGSIDLALTIDYGQRASRNEISASRKIAEFYNIAHQVIPIPFLQEQTHSALVNRSENLPLIEYNKLDDLEGQALESARQVWVPNRNGLFLNIAAVFGENMGDHPVIITGFNREEAATFPDNSLDFIEAVNRCLAFSTQNNVTVFSPTSIYEKKEIVREGLRLNVPFNYIWSCYESGNKVCGQCESCQRLKRALLKNDAKELVRELFEIDQK
ncbi:7-cyano-7-deazaguanine synthase QueC [Desulfosporosinus nitroreducens]|uniref:7-cyano-7-deazaguanine synthase n=1 Tax=Desulfosporosinus nitroreducens TaxID=2018668 RepID=A0ABT8QJH2_9FIRM|nr:7-cyano-7-deazaguanine synthase QueC [Desulfosporosinus nitroreducens]MCO1600365.1 7-cyano-7-deazaguanine synthase QueC [Desulfosporosinus nitroreducens]MDO0821453.1 7-cyano-7-deazaguanine synthase QueC [Desulfosporosinus nitroreducens]